jgi:alpha-beta hydrolase superfamily lysophospholipase
LILQAPYYNWNDAVQQGMKRGDNFNLGRILPISLLNKYSFNNYEFIQNCKMPLVIFHGTDDTVIDYSSSLKLKKHFKSEDSIITGKGENHETIVSSKIYQNELKRILKN